MRRTDSMRGSWDGWDAECSCGWGSHTGGAILARVREAVANHKWEVANGWWHPEGVQFSEKGAQAIREAAIREAAK